MLVELRHLIVGLVLFTAGCSKSAPVTPTLTAPQPETPYALSGTLTTTNGGTAVGGASIAANGATTTTDAAGGYSLMLPVSGPPTLSITITGIGLVTRQSYVAATGARSVDWDAISHAGFDMALYRALVRNSLESSTLEPLRRWTRSPNVYLQTTGIDTATLTMVESVIRESVPLWTNGLQVGSVEGGTGTREGQAGWMTVKWTESSDNHCGVAQIGLEGGWLELRTTAGCGCNGWMARPSTVRHELGHAMGFYHTDQPTDVMHASDRSCDKPITAREAAAAAVAYRRPVGNVDPDSDSVGTVNLVTKTVR
jgi:hypothetical protein